MEWEWSGSSSVVINPRLLKVGTSLLVLGGKLLKEGLWMTCNCVQIML